MSETSCVCCGNRADKEDGGDGRYCHICIRVGHRDEDEADQRLWSQLTGLPVTKVEVVEGSGEPAPYTIDGHQVYEGDRVNLTVEGMGGSGNGIYTVSSVPEPQFHGIFGPIFRYALHHEWWGRIMDRVAAWYIPRWQRWRGIP